VKTDSELSRFFLTYPSLWKLEESSEFDMEDHFLLDPLVRGDAALRCVGVVDLLLGVTWALSSGLVKDFSTLLLGAPRKLGLLGNTELCAKIKKFTLHFSYHTLVLMKHVILHNKKIIYTIINNFLQKYKYKFHRHTGTFAPLPLILIPQMNMSGYQKRSDV
jgi:hypothetical protein